MPIKLYLTIVFRIVVIFSIAILSTFIPEYLRDFFGDKIAPLGRHWNYDDMKWIPTVPEDGIIDTTYTWGARHYWYFWMMFLLFIVSIVDSIITINKLISKYYD